MDIPSDWISETELAAATGAVDRKRFHRNLLNWRHHGLLPERYDGISVADAIRHLGVGVGNEACYPPVYLPMVGRINELRARSRSSLPQYRPDGCPGYSPAGCPGTPLGGTLPNCSCPGAPRWPGVPVRSLGPALCWVLPPH